MHAGADYIYVVGGQIMIRKDGILRKSEYWYDDSYTITQVHTNGTITGFNMDLSWKGLILGE